MPDPDRSKIPKCPNCGTTNSLLVSAMIDSDTENTSRGIGFDLMLSLLSTVHCGKCEHRGKLKDFGFDKTQRFVNVEQAF